MIRGWSCRRWAARQAFIPRVTPGRMPPTRIAFAKLLREMEGKTGDERRARFVCVTAHCAPGPCAGGGFRFRRRVHHRTSRAARRLRLRSGLSASRTSAAPSRKLRAQEKNQYSHRGKAFRKIAELLSTPRNNLTPSAVLLHPIVWNRNSCADRLTGGTKVTPLLRGDLWRLPEQRPKLQPSSTFALAGSARAHRCAFRPAAAEFVLRPAVPERHRLIFYLGHLEAFDWNLLSGRRWACSRKTPEFDKLFAFGIDPVGGGLPTDMPADWPNIAQVEKYNRGVRERLDRRASRDPRASVGRRSRMIADGTLLHVAIEHRLMHAETLAYLLHNLPVEKKDSQHARPPADPRPAPEPRQVTIPAGVATLGQPRERSRVSAGTMNSSASSVLVSRAFRSTSFPVTNARISEIRSSRRLSKTPSYWKPEDWEWNASEQTSSIRISGRRARALGDAIPTRSGNIAACSGRFRCRLVARYVSHAEASAFARWAGKKLPTEAQWHRAAYGTPEGREREYPWGDASPDRDATEIFIIERWDPTPVDAHPAGASAFGVFDLLGNGWEWTSTPFGPLPGFEPFPFYPGYSADFFDGKHFVMKGGSPRTDACMLRRSFRNWFQPHYPYVYATFRCVEE